MATRRAARRLPRLGGGRAPVRLLAVLLVALAVAGTTWSSGATFTSSTTSRATVGAAADYYPPTVAVVGPGATSTGTVTVSATAADSASGVVRVVLEYAVSPSGAWTVLCTDTTAPWSCAWDTTKVADGDYRLRATAHDAAGFSAVSSLVTTTVANAAAVTLATIPGVVRGAVPLSATVTGAGGRAVSTTFSYVDEAGRAVAVPGCQNLSGTSPSCTWATGTLADVYDVRVVSVLGTGTTTTVSAVQTGVTVDNVAPTVTLSAPTPLSGTVQLVASPFDEDSGVAKVEVQYRSSLLGTWTTVCTVTADPYRCAFDSTKVPNGSYELRAIATDEAGNATTSTVLTRLVSNGAASITITAPVTGDLVRGTTTVTTDWSAPSGSTVSRVVVEARLGTGAWATVCTDTTAPYTCDWATSALASGSYDLRATMTYVPLGLAATTAVSPLVTVSVDNSPLRALDVQATNSGTAGRAGGGDVLTFTWSTSVDLTTVKSGWTGAATPFSFSLVDQKTAGPVAGLDWANLGTLGRVAFAQNYVSKGKTVALTGSLTAGTVMVNGVGVTQIRLVLDPVTSTSLRTSTASGTMRWYPTSTVRSSAGQVASTTAAAESGAVDADL